ncbi:hypothetical protein BRADI_5g19235v3 [Brachypodium distachyon]|uniref:Uncharacterized protein n=1 Tax=Brachypodium distachyon TaxID=15368 RepID=A0A2K2CI49_BRADI|nr:hypothetical protein BRADI_5g19235v3 [Brachypodium distachyon]
MHLRTYSSSPRRQSDSRHGGPHFTSSPAEEMAPNVERRA